MRIRISVRVLLRLHEGWHVVLIVVVVVGVLVNAWRVRVKEHEERTRAPEGGTESDRPRVCVHNASDMSSCISTYRRVIEHAQYAWKSM